MQRKVTNLLIALAVLSLLAGVASAQAPSTMMYQGRLTNAAGSPITTATDVTFTIYDDPSAGSALWTETIAGLTPDANGLFTVELGLTTPLTAAVFNGAARYLAIQVGADAEMTPRQPLTSAPYAARTGAAPGIAQGRSTSSINLNTAGMVDLATVTITIPADGYIFVQGRFLSRILPTVGTNGYTRAQIDETAGGTSFSGEYSLSGMTAFPSGVSNYITELTAQETYFKAAGTYTFRLEAMAEGSGTFDAFWPIVTAMYLPAAYGAVQTVAASGDSEGGMDMQVVSPVSSEVSTATLIDLRTQSTTGEGLER